MIQGCRYLQRSMDRWTLSKNSTTRLGLESLPYSQFVMRMFDYNYIHLGFIFIPCPNMTPGGLRAQYLIPNLMPKCECLSIHSSLPSARATSVRGPANPAQTVLLPNVNILPTAGTSIESSEEIFPCRTGFATKLGPQISLFPVPIFGVNRYYINLSFWYIDAVCSATTGVLFVWIPCGIPYVKTTRWHTWHQEGYCK
jgi:hypothetical protein